VGTVRSHTPEAAAPAAPARLWHRAVVAALVLWAMFLLVPTDWTVVSSLVVYPLADLAAVAAVLHGVRLYRPRRPAAWLFIAAGLGCFAIADVIYGIHQVAGVEPFPSAADVFYLAAYPLFVAGLQVASQARTAGDWGNLLDAAIITVTAALFAFLLIAEHYVADSSISLGAALVASAYPVADVLLLAVAVRFLLGISWRPPSLRLVAASLALILAGDIAYSLGELFTTGGDASKADALLLAGNLAMGLAGLHPSMVELTAEPEQPPEPLASVPRIVGLYLVSLVPVVVLATQALAADVRHIWITLVALGVVTILVTIRIADLVGQTHRAAARAATLSRLGSELLRGESDPGELVVVADRAASEIVRGGEAWVRGAGEDLPSRSRLYQEPVEVDGRVVAVVAADERRAAVRGTRDALQGVAHLLALALERQNLLAAQQAATESLAAQNAQLRDLDQMKDQLVGSVSHELRTPLTSIGGYTEMLLSGEFGDLNADQQEFVEVVDRNTRRLNRLIDDILFVSRVDAGRLSLERSWVDVAEVAAASVVAARPRAEQGEVRLEVNTSGTLPQVWVDATRLTQLFDNLVSNAVKFTPPGGTIRVTLTGTEETVQIDVADTGMGIPEEEVDRLFERFFRTSNVGEVAGTGLGLSIVKSIVEVHDGTISVTSAEGVGTTFHVELPVRPRSEAHGPEPKASR
jgi:signal transduction histidine kinase